MDFAVTSEPVAEPIALSDVKVFLRTIVGDTSEDDAVLIPMISAARMFCEDATGRALVPQTITAHPRTFKSGAELPRPPIATLVSATYKDKDGVEHEMAEGDCIISNDKVYFINPPTTKLFGADPISVTYTAGYTNLPASLRQAMLMLIAHWYNNREAVQIGSRINEVAADHAFENLIKHYRVWWF